MKSFKYLFLSVAVLSAMLTSCRQESSNLVSYEDYDAYYYSEADSTYAGQFKGVWNALNSNYGIWDYETVDWDEVYDKYLPKFEDLDKRIAKGDTITTAEIKDLYDSVVGPLQDGHFVMQFKNLQTGEFTRCNPFTQYDTPKGASKDSFYLIQEGTAYIIPDYKIYGVKAADTIYVNKEYFAKKQISKVLDSLQPRMDSLKAKDALTDAELEELYDIKRFTGKAERVLKGYADPFTSLNRDLSKLLNKDVQKVPAGDEEDLKEYSYDVLVNEFEQYNMLPWGSDFKNVDGLFFYASRLANEVMYLKLNQFTLFSSFQHLPTSETVKNMGNQLAEAFSLWFYGVQKLHKTGKLKGVIIDLRGNRGGVNTDFQLTLGALLPQGGYKIGKIRTKNGMGRLDYAPLTDLVLPTLSETHEVIDDVPIVVLTNTKTISMAEVTSVAAKQISNAYVIGNQTWGGLSSLNGGHPHYSQTYGSSVGIFDETSFALYIPSYANFYDGYGLLENKGVTPDIEVDFDPEVYLSTGHDTQLDRALEFIKTGK